MLLLAPPAAQGACVVLFPVLSLFPCFCHPACHQQAATSCALAATPLWDLLLVILILTAAVHAAAAASPAMLTSQSCSLLLKMLPLLRLLLQLLSLTMPWGQSSSHIFCWCLALQAHWQGADTAGVQHCPKLTLLCLEPIHEACMLETSVCNGA